MQSKILEKEKEKREKIKKSDWEFYTRKAERVLKMVEKRRGEEKERIQKYYNELLQKK